VNYRDGLEAALKIAAARLAGETGQSDRAFGYRLACFMITKDIAHELCKDAPQRSPETEAARVARHPGRAAGGHARAAAMTPETRSALARKAAQTRWATEAASAEPDSPR
jgi:hypothetical protein